MIAVKPSLVDYIGRSARGSKRPPAASFIAMAAWLLAPNRDVGFDAGSGRTTRLGVFGITQEAFFLAEMGDKTRIATVALAARFPAEWLAVLAGGTPGLMAANAPVVVWGGALLARVPMKAMRFAAAAQFAVLGLALLVAAA